MVIYDHVSYASFQDLLSHFLAMNQKKKSKHIFKLKASAENPAKKAYFRQNFKQNSSPIYVILYDLSCVHWSSTASGVV